MKTTGRKWFSAKKIVLLILRAISSLSWSNLRWIPPTGSAFFAVLLKWSVMLQGIVLLKWHVVRGRILTQLRLQCDLQKCFECKDSDIERISGKRCPNGTFEHYRASTDCFRADNLKCCIDIYFGTDGTCGGMLLPVYTQPPPCLRLNNHISNGRRIARITLIESSIQLREALKPAFTTSILLHRNPLIFQSSDWDFAGSFTTEAHIM